MRAPFVGTTLLSWQLVADPHRKLVYRPTCRPHLNRFRAGGLIYSPIGDPFQGAAIYACTLVWLMVLTTQSFAAMFAGCLLVSARQLSFACAKRSAKDMAISGRTACFNTCNKKLTMSPRKPCWVHIAVVSGSYRSYGTSLESPHRDETFSNWTFSMAERPCKVRFSVFFGSWWA